MHSAKIGEGHHHGRGLIVLLVAVSTEEPVQPASSADGLLGSHSLPETGQTEDEMGGQAQAEVTMVMGVLM